MVEAKRYDADYFALLQAYISTIANGTSTVVISQSKCIEFGNWFERFTKKVLSTAVVGKRREAEVRDENRTQNQQCDKKEINALVSDRNVEPGPKCNAAAVSKVVESCQLSALELGVNAKASPIFFHAKMELPRLRDWFVKNPSPCDVQLEKYAEALNGGEWRRDNADRMRVTKDKLKNWWKNERARRKRQKGTEAMEETDGEGVERKRKKE